LTSPQRHDPARVKLGERARQLSRDVRRDRARHPPRGGQRRCERAPVDVLHDQVVIAVVGEEVMNLLDRRMRHCGTEARLAPEAIGDRRAAAKVSPELVDHDGPSEPRLPPEIHVTRSGSCELLFDDDASDRRTCRHGVPRGGRTAEL
jgi:hypothetical protein